MKKIAAITISYYPDRGNFKSLIEILVVQVDVLVVVDNTPGEKSLLLESLCAKHVNAGKCFILRLYDNFGIAIAINVGVRQAIRFGADYVLLSDQDSLPASDMVAGLSLAYDECINLGFNVGAIGPIFTDLHTKITYPFQVQQLGRFFYGHEVPTPDKPHVEALTLITSGTLIPVAVLQDVGLMREDFFIDQVDIEWCHRARSKGYRLFGTGLATMYQRMGDSCLRVWYLRWRFESAYSSLRIYYRIRNFVALCRLDYIDWRWKIRSCWYWTGIVYSHVFFGTRRLESMKMALKGLWHGITKKMGRFDPDARRRGQSADHGRGI